MASPAFYFVNGLTVYRLITAPVLVLLVFLREEEIFKWMLAVSFTTDALDGFLARRLKVVSKIGTKLDSIADDATLLAAAIGVIKLRPDFVQDNLFLVSAMVFLVLLQNGLAFWRYGKMSSYHTYFAKAAMVLQGCFLILLFFLPSPPYWLFYPAAIVTLLDLSEEIVLVFLLPKWEADVKGLYWVMKRKKARRA